ncbi:ABC transporter ATP-binding protein [Agromyces intestinalis]|uniref:ABC transporter ATP-binding protein n=1 Tax=Agromyces intestinalis TaxID=2592652 RepID=A0A5C1YEN1_9MICO|nr:ABC transporter ATP-binding protein [Agromyces intestinalis]QEO14566.1 ABC transporter ATP-binding protein [Agromyces intestinalis]
MTIEVLERPAPGAGGSGAARESREGSSAGGGPPTPVIEVSGLEVAFHHHDHGWRRVVRGISLEVSPGECLALVGESGSGKSVTSRSLVGLAGERSRVHADRLAIDGVDARQFSERSWRGIRGSRIGFVLQDALASLDGLRPVGREIGETLELHTRLTRKERAQRVVELLTEVGVPEPELRARQHPYELSGGLRQRALIASAIAASPKVLIADEPTTALDATVAAQILRLLGRLKSDDGAMLLVSHDLAVVASIADRIAVMRDGEIVEAGTTEAVLHDPQHEYTKRLLAAIPSAASRGSRLSPDSPPAGVSRGRSAARRVEADATAPSPAIDSVPDGGPLIEASGLVKRFRGPDGIDRTVVDDVSFVLGRAETLGIVGESGSGKTTVARIALGVETATEGEVRVAGRRWQDLGGAERSRIRRRIQVVSQDPLGSFDPRYTVRKVLDEALGVAGIRGGARTARERELLDLVRLEHATLERRPLDLSGGQRQRVAIARALAVDPDVIVADEPVSALDVSVQAQILDLFEDIQREYGVAYLFISHDLGVVHHVADRVLVMKDGRVVESGEADAVFHRPSHQYTRALLDAIPSIASARRTSSTTTEGAPR